LPSGERYGIYILQFQNGEVYAGQTVDITRRFVQHRHKHGDVAQLCFKPCARDQLNEEERQTIWLLEENGFRLRNFTFTSVLEGETDFDLVMPVADQDRWLEGDLSTEPVITRTNDIELRRKYVRSYQRLLREEKSQEVIEVLRVYVQRCIPVPAKSELSFWAVSCLPGYHRRDVTIYCRININWQEVFTICRDEHGINFSWHTALSSLQTAYGETLDALLAQYPCLEIADHYYEPGGYDQINVVALSSPMSCELLNDSNFLRSMRLFNLRLMRRGPCVYSRNHCFDLADQLFYQPSNREGVKG